ncbi:SCP-like protein, partial [Ostertagia ostertagi]
YGCSKDLSQTDKTRKIFLDFHNDVRRNISTGIQPNRPVYSRFLGPAKNMYKLKWDCDLEKKAQYQVSSCIFKVAPGSCRLSMSQNSISVNYVNGKEEGGLRIRSEKLDEPRDDVWSTTQSQIANHKNMKLGCAYKVCGSEMLVSCIYGTKRIPPMQELWENGRTCECDAHPDSFCSNGICETNMVMKPETKTSTKKPRPPVYDCEIEANALRHAEKCRWGHSIKADRFGLGENVWASLQPEMNRSLAAEMARSKEDFKINIENETNRSKGSPTNLRTVVTEP